MYNRITINKRIQFTATNIMMSVLYDKIKEIAHKYGYWKNRPIKSFIFNLDQNKHGFGYIDVEIYNNFKNKPNALKLLIKLIHYTVKAFQNRCEFYGILANDLKSLLKYLKKDLKKLEINENKCTCFCN